MKAEQISNQQMKGSLSQRLGNWAQGRTGRFLLSQLAHMAITAVVLAALLVGAARAGALDRALAPAAQSDGSLTTISYQGRLADSSGTPIDNTNPGLGMTFALYDVDVGGSPLWGETHANVPVSDGLFSVRLGSVSALSTDLLGGDRWLGIQVGADAEMAPREKLSAVPYAMQAGLALTVPDEAITTEKIADGAVSQGKAPFAPLTFWHSVDDMPDPNMKIAVVTDVFDPGGSTSRDVDISAYGFTSRPLGVCEISDTGGTVAHYFCAYSWDGSSTSTVHIRLFSYDGTASGPSGHIRISLLLIGK
jgi:hypothetical protein